MLPGSRYSFGVLRRCCCCRRYCCSAFRHRHPPVRENAARARPVEMAQMIQTIWNCGVWGAPTRATYSVLDGSMCCGSFFHANYAPNNAQKQHQLPSLLEREHIIRMRQQKKTRQNSSTNTTTTSNDKAPKFQPKNAEKSNPPLALDPTSHPTRPHQWQSPPRLALVIGAPLHQTPCDCCRCCRGSSPRRPLPASSRAVACCWVCWGCLPSFLRGRETPSRVWIWRQRP